MLPIRLVMENRCKTVCQKQSGNDTEDQSGKDRSGNMFFIPRIKFFHLFPPQKSGMFGRNPLKHTKYNENYSMHAHLVSRNPQYHNIEGISLEKFILFHKKI